MNEYLNNTESACYLWHCVRAGGNTSEKTRRLECRSFFVFLNHMAYSLMLVQTVPFTP